MRLGLRLVLGGVILTVIVAAATWTIKGHVDRRPAVPASLLLPYLDRVRLPRQDTRDAQLLIGAPEKGAHGGPRFDGLDHAADWNFTILSGGPVFADAAGLGVFTGEVQAHARSLGTTHMTQPDVVLTFNHGQLAQLAYESHLLSFGQGRLYHESMLPPSPASPVDPGYSGYEADFNAAGQVTHVTRYRGARPGYS